MSNIIWQNYNSDKEYHIKMRFRGSETWMLFLDRIIKEGMFKRAVLWEFNRNREWIMWIYEKDHFQQKNMKCEFLRYDFILCVAHAEKPVSLEGSEGRNEIRVKTMQTS